MYILYTKLIQFHTTIIP